MDDPLHEMDFTIFTFQDTIVGKWVGELRD